MIESLVATAAFALPASQQSDVKWMVVSAFNDLSYSDQRQVCRAWKIKPVKMTKRFTILAVEDGYSLKPSMKGVIKGFLQVCGKPYGY